MCVHTDTCAWMQTEISYTGLAHTCAGNKPHDVRGELASWNPGEPTVQSWSEGNSALDPEIANVSA